MDKPFSWYEANGYEGCDCSLEISLYEYGLIWKEYKRATKGGFAKGELRFVYGVGHDGCEYNLFDWGGVYAADPEEEWNWADFDGVARFTGLSREEFLAQPITSIVSDLILYYGHENVFGGSYYPFEINKKGR